MIVYGLLKRCTDSGPPQNTSVETISMAEERQIMAAMQHIFQELLRVKIATRKASVKGPGQSPQQQKGGLMNLMDKRVLRI